MKNKIILRKITIEFVIFLKLLWEGYIIKISFSTLGCPDWSWQKILDESTNLGFSGMEIRGIEGEMYLSRIKYFNDENIKSTLAELRKRNLEIVSLNTSANFHDSAKFDSAVIEAKESIDLAEKLGVKYIRIFGDRILDMSKREETLDLIASGWAEVYKYSEYKEVTPLVEVHGDFNNIKIFKDILKKFNHPKFSVLWDIEHTYKVYEDNFLEFFGYIRPYVKHVHIKDTRKINGEWKLCNIGEGEIPIPKIIQLLAATNYNGYVSLEWEKKWHPELAECDIAFPGFMTYMKKILF